ncbi:nitroreductase family protein [Sphingopyxis sp. JAI128]|uniref:nitroreductase family protein n=1 Tax=Sphingopyxis sp. JAI128 TaxID=2723066 RepID=UPI001811F094|nr:nitroreductase family protein [Sphingopyxis sp. JAI128]MBB6427190.1 nitroreductase [Sphingopyxis sp. JAI128]
MLAVAKSFAKLNRNLFYDAFRYFRFSSMFDRESESARLGAAIKMDAHRIEKGLALPQSRPGFGQDVVARLIRDVGIYEQRFGADRITRIARSALAGYEQTGRDQGVPHASLGQFLTPVDFAQAESATIRLDAESVRGRSHLDFASFAHSRHSLRQFSADPVDPAAIEAAVRAAERTPSVCNRQSAKAYHIVDPTLRRQLLEVQGGNRGFGDDISELLIITSELRNFVSAAERYQCWIDGGLFAMSLVYALHAQGLGTCMLNWSVDPSRDITARKLMKLPPTQNIIVYIAVGHYPESFSVATSARLGIDDILIRL